MWVADPPLTDKTEISDQHLPPSAIKIMFEILEKMDCYLLIGLKGIFGSHLGVNPVIYEVA